MRWVQTAVAVLLLPLAACSDASSKDGSTSSSIPTSAKLCHVVPHKDWEGWGFVDAQSDGRAACAYMGESVDKNGQRPTVRVSVLPRVKRGDVDRRPGESAVVATGIGAPAVWITPISQRPDTTNQPATTSSTALGTEDRVGGRLVLSPPGRRVVIAVSGEYNNSAMAEAVAKVVLDRV